MQPKQTRSRNVDRPLFATLVPSVLAGVPRNPELPQGFTQPGVCAGGPVWERALPLSRCPIPAP